MGVVTRFIEQKMGEEFYNSFKYILSLSLLAISIFLSIALLSFYINGSADRSFFECSVSDLLFNSDLECENVAGRWGAWVSDMLINRFIGVMSFVIPVLLALTGFRIMSDSINLYKFYVIGFVIVMWTSVALGFIFFPYTDAQFPLIGGLYGYFVSKWLMSSLGVFGTVLFLLVTLFTILIFGVKRFNVKYGEMLSKITKGNIRLSKIFVFDSNEGESFYDLSSNKEELKESVSEASKTEHEEPVEDRDEVTYGEETLEERVKVEPDYQREKYVEEEDEEMQPVDMYCKPQVETPERKDDFNITMAVGDTEVVSGVRGSLTTPYDPTLDLEHYKMPGIELLNETEDSSSEEVSESYLRENKNIIVEAFKNFSIEISSIKATVGPTVTLYEIVPAPGTRISKIQGLENDIAMSLSALGIRIIAPIPGQGTVGIEVPNKNPKTVSMSSVLKSKKFQESKAELPVAMGKTISNEIFVFDLAKTPHLLVAGATGQGKSVGLNALITSLLYKKHPSQIKFVMVDPKRVELSIYRKLEKHFMAKMPSEDDVIITDVEKVKSTLNSLTVEMDSRYELLQKVDSRNIIEYNTKFINRKLNPEDGHRFLPYIVVIVDEFADLIMVVGKEIEKPIARIAQKARAVGIHMILATQRPSADVITGVIKANFPARIAFKVSAMQDSRTIIDGSGAQNLIGRGDMLCQVDGSMVRVQCAYVSTEEVMAVSEYISSQQSYACAYELPEADDGGEGGAVQDKGADMGGFDPLLRQISEFVVESRVGSASTLQRRFSIGFNRAGRLMDQMERIGVVGPQMGSKPRQILVSDMDSLERILQGFKL